MQYKTKTDKRENFGKYDKNIPKYVKVCNYSEICKIKIVLF